MKFEIFLDGFLGFADVDGEDDETFTGKLMAEFLNERLFFSAEVTPSGPEFEENHFAFDRSVGEFLAGGGSGVEARSGLFGSFPMILRRGGAERCKEKGAGQKH